MTLREVTAGIGAGLETSDLTLNLGPQHPSAHGMLRLRLTLDGDVVVSAEPIVGYLHRGAEKLFEVRDYRQIMVLANRHDWLSAFSNELGVALAVERLMGMEVPERAVWLRMAMAELNRVLNHLMFLGAYPPEIGVLDPMIEAVRARELLQAVMEEASGGRMHYMFNRVGGLKEEVPDGWTGRARDAIDGVRAGMPVLDAAIRGNERFLARTVGVGVLSAETAAGYGASGPVARASGLDIDLRRDEPYLAYDQLNVPVVTRTAGDAHARFEVMLDQVYVALDLASDCLRRVDRIGGPVNVRLPKVVKAPVGHTYAWTESPLGISGYYLVSRGEKTPWRAKMRTASYANVQALSAILPGARVADLVPILGSMFFVVGDIDK
ncbi:MAG TPA: NADH-quinone oxidoreductase subunit D [Micromonosporaceae bacterium]